MPLTIRPIPYIIPEYSLTGDLLSYLNCGLQYRYHNKGSLPPATPVQLWFGEFVHGVMEEAYLQWRDLNKKTFPWDWSEIIRPIEMQNHRRLEARGLFPPPNLFCPYDNSTQRQGLCPDHNHPHKLLASQRTEASINTWGQHLFPIIQEAEVKLTGIRPMPNYTHGISRSNYYGVTGVVDVLSSVTLNNAPPGNLILHYLQQNEQIQLLIDELPDQEYEIIIDYKGMRRPPSSNNSGSWAHHDWQVQTYAWLRSQQPDAKPVIAGIVFYLNELYPSKEDLKSLQIDISLGNTDIMPTGSDLTNIASWNKNSPIPSITTTYREKRSIRIFPINQQSVISSLESFDAVVDNIEGSVRDEVSKGAIIGAWPPVPEERTCTACDFKTFCPTPAPRKYTPTIP